jgi:serine/threonine protein kinase
MGVEPLASIPTETIGRFRVIRTLGRGAQGVVYLAIDPRLERQVAIKTLPLADAAGTDRIERLMQEARTASRLSHPNLVPVYEVGMDGATPYVVLEYVEGRTLRQILSADGAMAVPRAVITMSQILAGIAHAHGRGLVHGDITPSNILLSNAGVPRIMDFGIAREARAARMQVPVGTVGYLAPEVFEHHAPDRRADVFALGLILYEMLTGQRAIRSGNEYSAAFRTLTEPIPRPSLHKADIDPRLDEIVLRAVELHPEARYADALAMKEALDRYRIPSPTGARSELAVASTHSTVDFLLRRMRHKSDFPAFSQRIAAVSRLTSEANAISTQQLANLIVQDFALTSKLLKLANSAAVGRHGQITSVSQAITVLGFEQVRTIATGLMLSTPPQSRAMHPALPEVLIGAFVAGVLGRNLGRMAGLANVEEMFVCAMFSRLGEILAIYYLSEDYDEIVRLTRTRGESDLSASRQVLGLGFDELGIAIARSWNFPEAVLHAMRPLPEAPLPVATCELEKIAHCAGFAQEICDAAWRTPEAERAQALAHLIERFNGTLRGAADHLPALIQHSLDIGTKYCQAIGIDCAGSALIEGLAGWAAQASQPSGLAPEQTTTRGGASPSTLARDALAPPSSAPVPGHASGVRTGIKALVSRFLANKP